MKKFILTLLLPLMWAISFAQNKVEAEKIVDEGITLHDKGEYDNAIAKYNKALELDKDNLFALTEKAYSLLAQEKYEECIKVSEIAFAKHKTGNDLSTLYVTYGNALDLANKPNEFVAAYDRGIKQFPNEQMLYFNKAITLRGMNRNDEALLILEKSVLLKPDHPSSHNAISLVLKNQGNVIGALLASFRFFTIEPTGDRAQGVLARVQELMKAKASDLGNSKKGEKPKENAFDATYSMLSTISLLDQGNDNIGDFTRKFEIICVGLSTTKKENYGFLWDYYVPYFLELKDKGYSDMFAHVAFASLGKPEITQYFKDNQAKLTEFSNWSVSYKWPAK